MTYQDKYIGKKIEEYEIREFIGKGGMGAVYKGFDTTLNRPVAIKILLESSLDNPDMVRRFEREAKVIAEINHPNIAQIYKIGKIDNVPYYVMEFIRGKSLADILQEKGRISGSKCIDYIIQTAKGLRAAANHNIIHRDIKPANIMITEDGTVKIVDFGIAKVFRDNTFKTTTGTIMGTPRYMSPEQGKGGNVDLRSDIYSLGATFYHIIAGISPFDSDNPVTLLMKHFSEPVKSIKQFNAEVPDKLCNVIYCMMEKSPSERYQDYTQLIITLENLYAKREEITSYIPVIEQEEETSLKQIKKRKLLLIGLAAIVLIFIISLFLSPKKPEQKTTPQGRTIYDDGSMSQTFNELQKFQKQVDKNDE